MFCMLLRKHLSGGKLVRIRQNDLERVLFLDFDAYNELGDLTRLTLAVEIMGRYSNVIFLDKNEKILDSLKRVDEEMTSERLVLPGLTYRLPPPQNKLSLLTDDVKEIFRTLQHNFPNKEISGALLQTLQGVSPIVCREIQSRVCGEMTIPVGDLSEHVLLRLNQELSDLQKTAQYVIGSPHMAVNYQTGKPMDFSFLPITQYGSFAKDESFPMFSNLLDSFYRERDRLERMKVKTQGIHRILTTNTERLSRKINLQRAELQKSTEREHFKICGDLISANLYQIQKGDTSVSLCNFYEESQPVLTISLDPLKTPAQNAQKYYKDYRKAKTAEEKLKEQITMAEQELSYLDTVQDALSRASTERDLSEIRAELQEQGYIRQQRQKKKQKTPAPLAPMEFHSSDGFTILIGRNNRQNDQLTLRQANNNDLWLHVKDHPGSHTVILSEHRGISDTAIREAAQMAAYFSRCRDSENVAVDYTQIRNVSKPNGAKPGMVIYVKYKTVFVTPVNPEQ